MRLIAVMGDPWFLLLTRGEIPASGIDEAREARVRTYDRKRRIVSDELPFGSHRLANGYLQDVPDDLDTDAILAEVEEILGSTNRRAVAVVSRPGERRRPMMNVFSESSL